jgi:hypothetical protein
MIPCFYKNPVLTGWTGGVSQVGLKMRTFFVLFLTDGRLELPNWCKKG